MYNPYNPYAAPTAASTNLVWVMGIEGARAHPVAPGNTLLLMDSENAQFFLKTVDSNGFATVRTFTFQEVVDAAKPVEYVTPAQLDAAMAQLKEHMAALLQPITQSLT